MCRAGARGRAGVLAVDDDVSDVGGGPGATRAQVGPAVRGSRRRGRRGHRARRPGSLPSAEAAVPAVPAWSSSAAEKMPRAPSAAVVALGTAQSKGRRPRAVAADGQQRARVEQAARRADAVAGSRSVVRHRHAVAPPPEQGDVVLGQVGRVHRGEPRPDARVREQAGGVARARRAPPRSPRAVERRARERPSGRAGRPAAASGAPPEWIAVPRRTVALGEPLVARAQASTPSSTNRRCAPGRELGAVI